MSGSETAIGLKKPQSAFSGLSDLYTFTGELLVSYLKVGRGEWIRTTGLLVPNQALYQAEPRPES